MLSMEEWMDIKDLHRQGHSVREIARLTGHSRNTVRAVLKEKAPTPFQRPPRPSKPYLADRYKE